MPSRDLRPKLGNAANWIALVGLVASLVGIYMACKTHREIAIGLGILASLFVLWFARIWMCQLIKHSIERLQGLLERSVRKGVACESQATAMMSLLRSHDQTLQTLAASMSAESFTRLCLFSARAPRIIYTCRSDPIEENRPCPNADKSWPVGRATGWEFDKAYTLHIPVDELATVALLIWSYCRALSAQPEQEQLQALMCSSHAMKELPAESSPNMGYTGSDLLGSDILLVGENHLSRWFLRLVEPYLNLRFEIPEERKPGEESRFKVRFGFQSMLEYQISAEARLEPDWTRGSENAIAGLFCFPNPYNIRRQVVVFFGCHRHGQYLLDYWLRTPAAASVLADLSHSLQYSSVGGWQIAIHSSFRDRNGTYGDWDPKCALVTESPPYRPEYQGKPFIPIEVPPMLVDSDATTVDARIIRSDIVDISLIVDLTDYTDTIKGKLMEHGAPEFLFDDAVCYQEAQNEDVGLHITLYEFGHHKGKHKLSFAQAGFDAIQDSLQHALQRFFRKPKALSFRLLHAELSPIGIFLYCDCLEEVNLTPTYSLPWQPLSLVRGACDSVASENETVASSVAHSLCKCGFPGPFPLICQPSFKTRAMFPIFTRMA